MSCNCTKNQSATYDFPRAVTALSVSAGPSRVVKNERRARAQSVPVLRFVCLAGELTYVNVWLLLPAVDFLDRQVSKRWLRLESQ